MKKIIKMFKVFFHNIFVIIDRSVVTPITKVVFKGSQKFESSSKYFENWLSSTNTLLFISLFLAIAIFIMIDKKIILFNDNSAEVLQNQSVNVVYNEESYVVEGLPKSVDITLIGSKTDLYIAKQSSSHDVTIDLSGLKPGTHKVNVKYNRNAGNIKYMVNPSTVTVVIYQKVSKTMSLSTEILNSNVLDTKLVVDDIKYDTDKVVVKGAEHQLKQVASVKALVNLENLVSHEEGTNKLKDVPLVAYDSNGDKVDVEIVPKKIDVDVLISSPSEEVPIKIVPKGELSFGLGISTIELSEQKVTAYGTTEALKELKEVGYIPIEIDVAGLKENKEYRLEIPKPVGIKDLSTNNLTVKVTVGESSSVDFDNISIDTRNLSDDYSVQGFSKDDTTVTVTVKGVKSVIKNLRASDISAYIDLNGYKAGTYDVDVQVEGTDEKLQYISKTKQIKVKLQKK